MLEQAAELIDKGIHPIRIADGYDQACEIAMAELDKISDEIPSLRERHQHNLVKVAKTSLGSKMYVILVLPSLPILTNGLQCFKVSRTIRQNRR